MVLVGIDPGLAATGYAVVAAAHGRYQALRYGCWRTAARLPLGDRLLHIHDQMSALLREQRPATVVMERLYQLRDGSTGLAVGQAIGVVRLAAAQAGLDIAEYTPTHVKLTLVGHGQADKAQVQFMVQRLLALPAPPRPDHAADALALCVCHLPSGLSRTAGPAQPSAGSDRLAAALAADDRAQAAHRARLETP
ncbi:MAG: crossover junction endodeoxyribonuclease RuvC [Fimbriimonadaceae bacterium]|nr:crossover junction endodeoxyribonuclease RuvC [Fimbriimonadaceae bacterium]